MMRSFLLVLATLLLAAGLCLPPCAANTHQAPEPGPLAERLPLPVLHVEGKPRHIILVEKDRQLLHLLRYDGRPELLRSIPCTTGQNKGDKSVVGDLKTPEGVYFFTRHIDGGELPPLYGAGAFPMDYPNFFDRKDLRKGSGIWLHGVEYEGRVQKARDTRGCVAVGNDDFRELAEIIELRDTPIVVVKSLDWIDAPSLEGLDGEVQAALAGWLEAWQGKEIEQFIDHYAPDFRSRGMDRDAWKAYKDRFNHLYEFIEVEVRDLAVLLEAEDRAVVDFRLLYASDRYRDEGYKQLYLKKLPEGWKISGERWRPLQVERLEPPAAVAAATPPAAPAPAAEPVGDLDGLAVEDLQIEPGEGFLKVSFVLRNEGDEPASGYLSLTVADGGGRALGHYPHNDTRAARDYRRGEWFFAPDRRHVDAVVPTGGDGAAILRIRAFRHDGTLLLSREVSL